jgi:hypothetical protein
MFQLITDFINSIASFTFKVPLWLQIAIIIIVIIALSVGAFFLRGYFDISYMRSGVAWFIVVAVLNLSTILAVFIYYNQRMDTIKSKISEAKPGPVGKKGKTGKKGKYLTCSYCAKDIYIQKSHSSDVMCNLSTYDSIKTTIDISLDYFQNIINNGNRINYSNFVNGIIFGKTIESSNIDSINNFYSLMTPQSISYQLIKTVNQTITKASDDMYGTFRTPNLPEGYYPIGDSVYGGLEDFELNSFSLNGDVLHPTDYIKIVSFTSFNEETKDTDIYTIWRPLSTTITPKFLANNERIENATRNNQKIVAEPITYYPLGDICRYGDGISGKSKPNINETVTISSKCCIQIGYTDLKLVFIYFGALTFTDEAAKLDYSKTNTWLIKNKTPNDIQIFSVWRTPMNTFITNCNANNIGSSIRQPVNSPIMNQTFVFNMFNNAKYAINEYGNISDDYKKIASAYLEKITLPKILIAAMLCKHYQIELYKEIVYYFSYYQKGTDKNGEPYFPTNVSSVNIPSINTQSDVSRFDSKTKKFSMNKLYEIYDTSSNTSVTSSTKFGYIMNLIDVANNENDAYNDDLIRKASLEASGVSIGTTTTRSNRRLTDAEKITILSSTPTRTNSSGGIEFVTKPTGYDPLKERHLPKKLMDVYDYINTELLTISVRIENSTNLLDIVNTLFDNGIESRIAVDAIGLAEGGSLLNEVQETVLILCKMIMPPTQAAYIISDDCLGTFALDRNRESSISLLSETMDIYRKLLDNFFANYKKYQKIEASIIQYNDLLAYDIGIICSHIDDNWNKLNDMDLEEFTTARIKQITAKYNEIIIRINAIMESV